MSRPCGPRVRTSLSQWRFCLRLRRAEMACEAFILPLFTQKTRHFLGATLRGLSLFFASRGACVCACLPACLSVLGACVRGVRVDVVSTLSVPGPVEGVSHPKTMSPWIY